MIMSVCQTDNFVLACSRRQKNVWMTMRTVATPSIFRKGELFMSTMIELQPGIYLFIKYIISVHHKDT